MNAFEARNTFKSLVKSGEDIFLREDFDSLDWANASELRRTGNTGEVRILQAWRMVAAYLSGERLNHLAESE